MSEATPVDEPWKQYPCIETDWWRDRDGYGHRYIAGSGVGGRRTKSERSNRFALAQKLGRPILPGMFACHHCDNPPCIQPEHLYEGTPADNSRDMMRRGRQVIAGPVLGKRGYLLSDEEKSEIRRRYAAGGITQRVLADEFDVTQGTISNVVKTRSPDMPPGRRRGEHHHRAKITEQDVRDARRRRAAGEKQVHIRRDLGISSSQMRRILDGESWGWLE